MHQSIVTTAPDPRGRAWIAGKMCRVFTFASSPQCRGFLFLDENSGDYSCARKNTIDCVVLLTVGLINSRDFLNGKSKSPLCPGVEGPWLQMTSALCA